METKHIAVGLIIIDGKLAILDHIKIGLLTAPMGKQEPREKIRETLNREMFEEVDIVVKEASLVSRFTLQFDDYKVLCNVFHITEYVGPLWNKEPQKHREILYLTHTDLLAYKGSGWLDKTLTKCMELNVLEPLFN